MEQFSVHLNTKNRQRLEVNSSFSFSVSPSMLSCMLYYPRLLLFLWKLFKASDLCRDLWLQKCSTELLWLHFLHVEMVHPWSKVLKTLEVLSWNILSSSEIVGSQVLGNKQLTSFKKFLKLRRCAGTQSRLLRQ